MIDRRELLVLAACGTAATASGARPAAQGKAPRKTRASEVRALRTFAEATHPRGREAREDPDWQRRWGRLERTADGLPDGAYFVRMRQGLAWFEDGHTTVLPFEFLDKMPDAFARGPFALHLPWKVRLFDDGAYVMAASDPSLLGQRVDKLGSLSTAALMSAFDATWPGSRAWAHNWGGHVFAAPAQLQALGAVRDPRTPIAVGLSGVDGIAVRPAADPGPLADFGRPKSLRELWAAAAKRDNYVKLIPDRRAIYLSIDDMSDVEGATFEQLTREAFHAMESPDVERLVIDLRRNGGGDNYLGEPLRKHVEASRFNAPGRLFVMAGPATFSAAQNLANRLERETYAVFVGGPTGLAPNHFGDAKIFTGEVTGLTAMVSTFPWFDSYPQDKRQWIMPDLLVRATFEDWRAGRDPALDAALTEKFVGVPDDLSPARVFFYSRASQKQDWKPFWA